MDVGSPFLLAAEERVWLFERVRRGSCDCGVMLAGEVSADEVLAMEKVGLAGMCMEAKRSGVGPAAASKVKGTLREGAPPSDQ